MVYHRNYKRKRNYKRNYKRKANTTQMRRVAHQVARSLIPQKRMPNDGTHTLDEVGDPHGVLIKPYFIVLNDTLNNTDEKHKRNGDQIWVNRTSGIFHVEIPATCVNRVDVRHICGWYKGTGAVGAVGGPNGLDSSLSASGIEEAFSNRLARYDPANWKIITDRTFSRMPHQIYDLNGSDDRTAAGMMPLDELMVGVWKPITVKCNFRFNKKFKYADGKQGDDSELATSGESLVGWKPFIYLQVRCPEQPWNTGNELPISYKFTTYFKDLI